MDPSLEEISISNNHILITHYSNGKSFIEKNLSLKTFNS